MAKIDKGYFSSARDAAIIARNGFFCQACLMGKPAREQSPDPRYCKGCCDFLLKEAEQDSSRGVSSWKPILPQIAESFPVNGCRIDVGQVPKGGGVADDTRELCPPAKRGRKVKVLPDDRIKELEGQGMGSKAIARQLGSEGIEVSYRTVLRRKVSQI